MASKQATKMKLVQEARIISKESIKVLKDYYAREQIKHLISYRLPPVANLGYYISIKYHKYATMISKKLMDTNFLSF